MSTNLQTAFTPLVRLLSLLLAQPPQACRLLSTSSSTHKTQASTAL